jgi:heat-inducible transcriptional repressor
MGQGIDDRLNERARQLLRVLVESYIRDGQPVGSRALSRDSGLSLSSATIRNVMADLEELGFVASPHTSAGRIPTDRGYRFFVDTLLRSRPPETMPEDELRRALGSSPAADPKAMVANASQLLSNLTRLAGVVTVPRPAVAHISQIEFVGLSENRVLVVMVFDDREVQNRIIHLPRPHAPEELRRAAQFLTEQLVGRTPEQARSEILRQLQQDREHMNALMLDAISAAQQVFEQGGTPPARRTSWARRSSPASRSSSGCSRPSTRSATSCTCSTRACMPTACRSSSVRSRAIRCSTTAAS